MAHANEADLRQMVRELLREAVQERKAAASPEPVRITSDGDLQTFIAKLSAPGVIEAVRAGRLHFTLEGANTVPALLSSRSALYGVVSERKLSGCIAGETIILAPDAVLTPLARDAARRLGLKIERKDR